MGGGALEPKTVAGVSKKAFTLAEVLITLAIIGVVAALTIPTVVAKYQQKMYYTQFMKVYNTLSNALSLAIADYGDFKNTECGVNRYDEIDEACFMKNVLGKYMKITDIVDCESIESEEEAESFKYYYAFSYLDGTSEYNDYGTIRKMKDVWCNAAVLSDGSLIRLESVGDNYLSFGIDTNGPKAPNIRGRDMFQEGLVWRKVDGKNVLVNSLMIDSDDDGTYHFRPREEVMNKILNGDEEVNCNPNVTSRGDWCVARLLIEGKMDY